MAQEPEKLEQLDRLLRAALDGEALGDLLAGLDPETRAEAEAMLAELGLAASREEEGRGAPAVPAVNPEAEVVARFLDEYWEDRAAGRDRALGDYLARHPGAAEAVARCYLALEQDSGSEGDRQGGGRLGAFKLGEIIGRGGQATVYRAQDEKLGRVVALKVFDRVATFDDKLLARFKREARALSRLNHPDIGRVYDAGVVDGLPCIAMELIEGSSLARILADEREAGGEPRRLGKRDLEDKLRFLERIALALHAAHEQGIVHRDLKPANVLVRPDGAPVLVDFGLAAVEGDAGISLTGSHDLLGTPAYIAPERLRSGRPAASRLEDVYALGVTAYELISGQRPFEGPTVEDLFHRILRGDARPIEGLCPGLPRDLAMVVRAAMELDPRHRYQDAAHLAADLGRLRRGESVSVRPVGPVTRSLRWYRRNAIVASTALFIVVALAAFTVYVITKNRRIDNLRLVAVERANALTVRNEENKRLREEAVQRADELSASLQEVLELSDVKKVDDLVAEERTLWPIAPATAPRMRAWLDRARDLVSRCARHQAQLETILARRQPMTPAEVEKALPEAWKALQDFENSLKAYDEGGGSGLDEKAAGVARQIEEELIEPRIADLRVLLDGLRNSNYPDAADAWRADVLARLVKGIEDFRGLTGHIASIELRLEKAETLAEKTVDEHREAWARAARELAADPRFAGFVLEPIAGLVPLGRDPESGLQEFLHYLTQFDEEIPKRDAQGHLPKVQAGQGLVFVLLPGGRFSMGAITDPGDPDRDRMVLPHESPRQEIELDPFLVSKYELWQGLWLRVTSVDPSTHTVGMSSLPGEVVVETCPVECVNWYDCYEMLRRIDLDLPTEAQWEYFARAGTRTIWSFGNDPELGKGRMNIADQALTRLTGQARNGYSDHDDGWALKAPVDSYAPNPWGLYCVYGNVFEWCLDRYGYYDSPVRKGDGLRLGRVASSDLRMFRGGAYGYGINESRTTNRIGTEAESKDPCIGLRPVMTVIGRGGSR
ncbi:MAG: protein kinase [Planctomycetes bacterium]|nr:protein kinase [Planctomycetota bacterium]